MTMHPTQPTLPAPFAHPPALLGDSASYLLDRLQRSILTLDVLRQRGNVYLEHARAGNPPVLVFDYEMVMDGRELERPANYALVRIIPPADSPTDPKKRPFVVIDPRAGHGPGIGGTKIDSEIGIALRGGHPCYLVMFFPDPVPGQTIECIANAEVIFLKKVLERHPEREGMPLVIGNCQGGWALMLLAAMAPDLVGPVLLAGTPLSYWAGVEGKNPMRYNGGLMGGTWLSSMMGDLGDGKFDGAWLVYNFEQLNPANTYWSKPYRLFSKVDTEAPRFLDFERWWGGHFLLNREEIDWIVQNLFVGNRLTGGEITVDGGKHHVDLRNIRTPIIVFASWGDNITPPQQALNWIPDLYADAEDIRAHGQTIVYCLHENIGHLGIFVSAGVAQREHAELVSAIDLIDTMEPGLYEAVIEDTQPGMSNLELINGRYLIRFEPRQVSDILALGDGREHEKRFELVRRVAEVNQALYDQFASPWVKLFSNALSASALRALHPARVERYTVSDLNPWLWPIGAMADTIRNKRAEVAADNPFVQLEKHFSGLIEDCLDHYRDQRDQMHEQTFKHLFESPWMTTLLGARRARRSPTSLRAQLERLNIKAALHDFDHGGALDAFARVIAYVRGDGVIDVRPFNMMRRILSEQRVEPVTLAEYRDSVQRQSFVLMLDEERALQGLPKLLPDRLMRKTVMDFVLEVLGAAGPLDAASAERYQRIKALLGLNAQRLAAAPAADASPHGAASTPPKVASKTATPRKPAKPKGPAPTTH
ncbi:DUF3141 domain-containing protein [Chitinimonas sp.]|uniref:DUF3141 domain-containing protein n=1 Tax=Chitinimonas sp. TaxID=1934313 RepID=UPI0035AFCD5D